VAGEGRRCDLYLGLSGNVIKARGVREHGDWVEISGRRRTPGEDLAPELLRGMGKEGGKLPSLLGDELSFFVAEKATVVLLDGRI